MPSLRLALARLPHAVRRLLPRALGLLAALALAAVVGAWALDAYGRSQRPAGRYDAIVVAGATVWRGGKASKALRRRTLAAVDLWKAGHAPLLVLTGGRGLHLPAQAEAGAALAREQGVPESALRVEDRSRNTVENAAFSRELLGAKRVMVVSDAYHVLRCELVFEHYFPEVGAVGVPLGQYPPMADALREVAALVGFALFVAPRWLWS